MDYSGIFNLLEKHAPPAPKVKPEERIEIQRAIVRSSVKQPHKKCTKTQPYVVKAIYEEYLRQKSLSKTAKVFGLCKSAIFYLLKRHGYAGLGRRRPKFIHKGLKYAWNGRYYYRTDKGHQGITLHKTVWEERHGPVPKGYRLVFLTDDTLDMRDSNLVCLPVEEANRLAITLSWRRRKQCHKNTTRTISSA